MGEHKGWLVRKQDNAWVGRAWDPGAGKYRSRSWQREPEAKRWAQDQHARFRVRMESASAPTTSNMVRDYVSTLERLGRKESHLSDVRLVLSRFAKAVPDLNHPRSPTLTSDWLASMEKLAPSTRNRHLITCKGLCNWAVRHQRLVRNPLVVVDREHVPSRLKPQFSMDELRRLVSKAGDHYHSFLCVLLYTGTRIDEAAHLRWEDVDFSGNMVAVTLDSGANIKRDKERLIALQPELAAYLLAIRPEHAAGPIFGHVGAHRGARFAAYLKRCGVTKGRRTPHSLRHCYAGLQTAAGLSHALLRAYMGHSADSTTASYAKMATSYVSAVEGWPRGQFQLMQGAASAWPRVAPTDPRVGRPPLAPSPAVG